MGVPAVPEIHYARSGDVHIAYQSWGSGPAFIGVPPFAQNIEALWSDPSGRFPQFLRKLGSFTAVTQFDKRGSGLSDRATGPRDDIESRVDDLRAVMDTNNIERAFIGGVAEGGPIAMLFAATHPDRVQGLILGDTAARFVRADDYHAGLPSESWAAITEDVAANWGTSDSVLVPWWMPSMTDDVVFRRWMTTYERACASPGAVRAMLAFIGAIDVRQVLSSIQCPTVIIHRTSDSVVPVEHGRYLAEHIASARYVELPGIDHLPWVGDAEAYLDEIEDFITGHRGVSVRNERMLATVLFTDIVGSTERASAVGDAQWRLLLDKHDRLVRAELERFGGREVKTMGDGFLAIFDSPSRGVRAAKAMAAAVREAGLEIRAGLHAGEIERRDADVAGLAVHVGARVVAEAEASEVLVSSTVRDLVLGSEFRFRDRGKHHVRGIEGEWQLYSVE
jgi:class 3 adenylate cyclase